MTQQGWRPRLRWGTPLPGLLPVSGGHGPLSAQQPWTLAAPFVRVALLISIAEGLTFGIAAAVAPALGGTAAGAFEQLAAAHGWVQLVGFLSLFILAVGVHFLPRLRGSALQRPRLARVGLLLLSVGSALAPIASFSNLLLPAQLARWASILALCIAVLPVTATTLVMTSLVTTLRHGPPLSWRGGLTAVLPFLIPGLAFLWLTLFLKLALAVGSVAVGVAVSAGAQTALLDAVLLGFALPVAIGVSTRVLPIFLGVEVVKPWLLTTLAVCVFLGTACWVLADVLVVTWAAVIGHALLGGACIGHVLTSGVPFGGRRAVRRADPPALVRATRLANLLIRLAHLWLLATGVLLVAQAVTLAGGWLAFVPDDASRHALSVGYLMPLIFGVGARLLPGFARQRVAPTRALAVCAASVTVASALRVGAAIAASLWSPGEATNLTEALAGCCLIVALAALLRHVWPVTAGERWR